MHSHYLCGLGEKGEKLIVCEVIYQKINPKRDQDLSVR
jgi:hypothetical protein